MRELQQEFYNKFNKYKIIYREKHLIRQNNRKINFKRI